MAKGEGERAGLGEIHTRKSEHSWHSIHTLRLLSFLFRNKFQLELMSLEWFEKSTPYCRNMLPVHLPVLASRELVVWRCRRWKRSLLPGLDTRIRRPISQYQPSIRYEVARYGTYAIPTSIENTRYLLLKIGTPTA